MAKTELFGTILKPNVRWTCERCKAANVTNLGVPIRSTEPVSCRKCHRVSRINFDMRELPPALGGTKGVEPELKPADVVTRTRDALEVFDEARSEPESP